MERDVRLTGTEDGSVLIRQVFQTDVSRFNDRAFNAQRIDTFNTPPPLAHGDKTGRRSRPQSANRAPLSARERLTHAHGEKTARRPWPQFDQALQACCQCCPHSGSVPPWADMFLNRFEDIHKEHYAKQNFQASINSKLDEITSEVGQCVQLCKNLEHGEARRSAAMVQLRNVTQEQTSAVMEELSRLSDKLAQSLKPDFDDIREEIKKIEVLNRKARLEDIDLKSILNAVSELLSSVRQELKMIDFLKITTDFERVLHAIGDLRQKTDLDLKAQLDVIRHEFKKLDLSQITVFLTHMLEAIGELPKKADLEVRSQLEGMRQELKNIDLLAVTADLERVLDAVGELPQKTFLGLNPKLDGIRQDVKKIDALQITVFLTHMLEAIGELPKKEDLEVRPQLEGIRQELKKGSIKATADLNRVIYAIGELPQKADLDLKADIIGEEVKKMDLSLGGVLPRVVDTIDVLSERTDKELKKQLDVIRGEIQKIDLAKAKVDLAPVLEAIGELPTSADVDFTPVLEAIGELPISADVDFTPVLDAIGELRTSDDVDFTPVLRVIGELPTSADVDFTPMLEAIDAKASVDFAPVLDAIDKLCLASSFENGVVAIKSTVKKAIGELPCKADQNLKTQLDVIRNEIRKILKSLPCQEQPGKSQDNLVVDELKALSESGQHGQRQMQLDVPLQTIMKNLRDGIRNRKLVDKNSKNQITDLESFFDAADSNGDGLSKEELRDALKRYDTIIAQTQWQQLLEFFFEHATNGGEDRICFQQFVSAFEDAASSTVPVPSQRGSRAASPEPSLTNRRAGSKATSSETSRRRSVG